MLPYGPFLVDLEIIIWRYGVIDVREMDVAQRRGNSGCPPPHLVSLVDEFMSASPHSLTYVQKWGYSQRPPTIRTICGYSRTSIGASSIKITESNKWYGPFKFDSTNEETTTQRQMSKRYSFIELIAYGHHRVCKPISGLPLFDPLAPVRTEQRLRSEVT